MFGWSVESETVAWSVWLVVGCCSSVQSTCSLIKQVILALISSDSQTLFNYALFKKKPVNEREYT